MNQELELQEFDSRPRSVVLSVRLDLETARRLHHMARRRGVRVSDLLREAAKAFVDREEVDSWPAVEVVGGVTFSVGRAPWPSAENVGEYGRSATRSEREWLTTATAR